MGLCKFQAQRAFTWKSVLENNINHILGPHLKFKLLGWDGFLTVLNSKYIQGSWLIIIFLYHSPIYTWKWNGITKYWLRFWLTNKSLGQLATIRGVSIKLTMKWKGQGVFWLDIY